MQFQDLHNTNSSARHAMSNFILTTSEELKKTEDYQKVSQVVFRLMESGVTFAAKGYCISMSDIVYTMLTQIGIKCKIVECGLTIDNKLQNQLYVVGYDNLRDKQDSSDTHVVVVTDTNTPMLIDVSIAHLLPNNLQGIIDACDNAGTDIIANINTTAVSATYKEKKKFSIPMLHQISIVDRIKTDITTLRNIKLLKILVLLALTVSLLNAGRGLYDFYNVYLIEDNNWGPSAIIDLNRKIDAISEKLK